MSTLFDHATKVTALDLRKGDTVYLDGRPATIATHPRPRDNYTTRLTFNTKAGQLTTWRWNHDQFEQVGT